MRFTLFTTLLFTVTLAVAQDVPPNSLQKFQEFVSPNDERVKVFMEIEAKAEAGDTKALKALGEYYFYGKFPVLQNQQKAKDTWLQGVRLGSADCAGWIYSSYPDNPNDSEVLIERTKWGIIQRHLGSQGRLKYRKPKNLSDSSFEEAGRRAEEFLMNIKVSPNQSDTSDALEGFSVPSPRSIKEAQAFRMNLLTEFRKVQSPLYLKLSMASPAEVSSYSLIARKLERVQERGISAPSSGSWSSGPQARLKEAKIKEIQAQLSAFKIKTSPPFTRQDLNQAQTFLDRYRDLLDTIEKGL